MTKVTRGRAIALVGAGMALVPAALQPAGAATESNVSFDLGGVRIAVTLALPDGKPPYPVVLIIAGSGPTDRNGNSTMGIAPDSYKLLAAALAERGIASLRYDKRGIAASATPGLKESDARFSDFVDDAYGLLQRLGGDARFGKLFVAGHSEGSLIGMIAGARAKVAGYVSLCGIGRPAYSVLHDQLAPQLPPDSLAQADAIMAQLRNGKQVTDIPPGPIFAALFRPSIQPYLISWFTYDPTVEIKKLTCPIAIVGGTKDIQIPVADAQALSAAAPAASLKIVEGMSHTLKHVDDAAGVTQQKTYVDPSLPIEPAVVDVVATLVSRAR